MDTPTTIIGLVILLICLLPFLLISNKNAKKKKIRIQYLNDSAQKTNGTIHKNEFWSQSGIGLDTKNKVVYYSNETSIANSYTTINLKGIQSCSIVRTEDSSKAISKLDLQLNHAENRKLDLHINFFDKEKNILLANELEIINRWHKTINDNL
jgi:hypothetical protein